MYVASGNTAQPQKDETLPLATARMALSLTAVLGPASGCVLAERGCHDPEDRLALCKPRVRVRCGCEPRPGTHAPANMRRCTQHASSAALVRVANGRGAICFTGEATVSKDPAPGRIKVYIIGVHLQWEF